MSTNIDNIITKYPESLAILRSYAYINYELSTGFGYNLTKKAKKIGLNDNDVNKKLAGLKRNAYSEARSAYEKILKSNEMDIKSHYRYARLLKKEYTASGYKFSAEVKHNDGKLINWHFLKVKRLYESLLDKEKKQRYFSCYIKSLYNYAAYTFDVILPSLSLRLLLNAEKYNKIFYIPQKSQDGIEWKNDKIKNARLYLEKAAQLAHCELKPLNNEDISRIAIIQEPFILPIYFFYTYAKMFYAVSILYTSSKKEFKKYREAHPEESDKKADEYLSLAAEYCQYAINIRRTRKRHGFSDSDGIYPEIDLLGKIYTIMCFRTGNGEKISKLYENKPKNDDIKFYHAICLYYLDQTKNHDTCIKLLKEIKSRQYKAKAEQEIEYINNGNKEG